MKKILLTSLFALSIISVKAQISHDDIYFTNLYGKEFFGNDAEKPNYRISNKLIPNKGWVLDTYWWGGIQFETQNHIKLKSRFGTVYVSESGYTGINTENPQYTLDVYGNFRVTNDGNYFFYNGGGDLKLSYQTRGTGGRAIVHDTGNTLSLNYENDFTGGTRIGNTFLVKGDNASLQGKFEAKEIKVTLTPTADFVFAKDYDLPKLEDVEKHIKEKKHLPEIASAKQMEKEGVNVGEFQIKLLQKIEELTLYTIEQNKQLKIQKEEIELLKKQMNLNNQKNR
ncbi:MULTISPECIES: hypothetical protein [Chryseobacterium]|uniref:hypothetical protein n=1 Tax=Chryseobacterium TaxID=59732 RepID=UPI001EF9A89A|nr:MULTISPECIES: hypothetical protein [Chryseobacterium]MBM7417901.1 hypothetical protein [Chryseobacterium sp. JUb44]MDH6212100.1 hypothetical protein [Chryseobacterium sp. BIGb0186]WSO10720.1 hypothetical protein VUJ64_02105 [Chryseobacterium scophthalmum]